MTRAAAKSAVRRGGRGRRIHALPRLLAVLAIAVAGCATIAPSALDSAAGLIAPPGEIVLPPCSASAAGLGGFVVGSTHYGISCHGIEPASADDEPPARGQGEYQEARAIEGIPPDLWLAVRGDLPYRPSMGEPQLYEWYLAGASMSTQADREEWGERVASLTLPWNPEPGAKSAE